MSALSMGLVVAAIAVGALVPLQAGVNATLAAHAGNALFAATVNFLLASALLVALALTMRVPFPFTRVFAEAPSYAWLGGLCGATLVFSTIVLAPRLGATAFVCATIVGTVLVSLVLDHFGLLAFKQQPVTGPRLLGGALVVLGMLLVQRA